VTMNRRSGENRNNNWSRNRGKNRHMWVEDPFVRG
jgi:hypothetical protein